MGLDGVEIIVAIEKGLDIRISDQEAEKIETIGQLHDCVWKLVQNKEFQNLTKEDVMIFINETISNLQGINLKEITSEKRIVKDLGID